jgi:steroid 5-alpha reductase family enzyme
LVQRFIKIFFVRCCILFVLAAPIAAVETAKRNSTNDKGKGAMSGASIFFLLVQRFIKNFLVRCCILFVLAAPIASVETAKRNSTNDKDDDDNTVISISFFVI